MTDAARDALVRVFRVLAEIGKLPANEFVFSIVRGHGRHRFTDKEGKAVLAAERIQGRRPQPAPEPPLDLRGHAPEPPPARPSASGATRTRERAAKELSKLVPIVQDRLPGTDVPGTTTPFGVASTEPEWVTALRGRYQALFEFETTGLRESGRITVARYCALEFGHCRRDENVNRRKSKACLTSLGNLIEILRRNGAPFSVGQFDRLARRYHAEIGGGPWYTPCDIKALLVLEKAR